MGLKTNGGITNYTGDELDRIMYTVYAFIASQNYYIYFKQRGWSFTFQNEFPFSLDK